MWLVATAKNGIGSVELGRRLGVKQANAWALKQKVMAVMTRRENAKRLDGRVEMDDAYLGGYRPGKRGRGAAGKQPFVAAVSTSDDRARSSSCRSRASARRRPRSSSASTCPRPAVSSPTGSAAGPWRPRPAWSIGRW
jgi:ISXO2-like transposase domain